MTQTKFKPSSKRVIVVLILATLCLAQRPALAASPSHCARTLCLIATGVACLVERIPIETLLRPSLALLGSPVKKLAIAVKDNREEGVVPFALTGRGPIEYLDGLGLYSYDFAGKAVLDIASGNGRFAQMVNLVYAKTGTSATSIDLYSQGPFFGSRSHQKGDAYQMEFDDKSFDLTVNNWMIHYSLRRTFSEGDTGELEIQRLADLIYEQLRVTSDGGEARIGFGMNYLAGSDESVRLLHWLAINHPRVEEAEVIRPLPLISGDSYLRVVIKPETPDEADLEPPNKMPEPSTLPFLEVRRSGFQMFPTISAAGVLLFGKYFLF